MLANIGRWFNPAFSLDDLHKPHSGIIAARPPVGSQSRLPWLDPIPRQPVLGAIGFHKFFDAAGRLTRTGHFGRRPRSERESAREHNRKAVHICLLGRSPELVAAHYY